MILDLTLGALAPEARQRTWAHVERCPQCAALIGAALPFLGPDPPRVVQDREPPEAPPSEMGDSAAGAARASADTVPGPQITEPAPQSLQPGQDLHQRYRVVRYVGRGGMGEVYEARHARLVGRYALKILNVDLTHNPMARQRFRREAGIASQLRHPNIVQVIDFDETEGGRPYLVMELLEGRDLGALIAEGPLPLERTLRLARQIAAGLAAMHAQGIVHRDLKPANVFVLAEGSNQPERIKLVDFGLSKRLVPSLAVTHDRMLLGTPQYMAPEQARGNSDTLGPAADQFAMAAIVYEMLAGRPAFDGELLSVVLYRIVHEPPEPLATLVPGLPPGIDAAIARGLAKEPDARFPSVSEFWEALEAGGRSGGGSVKVGGTTGRRAWALPALAGRARWVALSAGLVGAGLVARWILIQPARPGARSAPSAPAAIVAERPSGTAIPRLDPPPSDPTRFRAGGDTLALETARDRPGGTAKPTGPARAARAARPRRPPPAAEPAAAPVAEPPAEPVTTEPAEPAGPAETTPVAPDPANVATEPANATKGKRLVPHL